MDNQRARAEEVVRAELVRSGMPGRPNALARQIVEALAALPVAPEQPTQAIEEQIVEAWKILAAERWGSKGEDHPRMPAWFRTGYRLGLSAALVSSPSVETETPDKETIDGRSVAEVKAEALREAREEFHDWEGVADVLDARAAALLANAPDEHFGVSS